jgi:hypothetical protein
MKVIAGVVSGCAVAVTTAIAVGFLLHNRGHHLFQSAREMSCENDLGDREDDYDDESSHDCEKEIFDVEVRGYGDDDASTDGSAEWRKLGIHDRRSDDPRSDAEDVGTAN